jgi:hypothetical protein
MSMKEVLGNNLEKFFKALEYPCDTEKLKMTYKGVEYEVWEMADTIFNVICKISEKDFIKLAGKDAWWRSSTGSVLGVPTSRAIVNGKYLICWDDNYYLPDEYEKEPCEEYDSLTEYLCNKVGASLPKNIVACAMDLAKYNNMSLGELFSEYEG